MTPNPLPLPRDPDDTLADAILPDASSASEAELVVRARSDAAAFGLLFRRHYPAIQRYVRRRLGDRSAVEDVVSETFATAYHHLGRYRDRGLPFRAWLYRLATSRIHRWLRAARWRRLLHLEFEPEIEPADDDRREVVRRALCDLPPRLQAALVLHYIEGLSIEEIVAVLGCRPGTVKSRLARGRAALRTRMEQTGWNQ